jgi:hypothetical protein
MADILPSWKADLMTRAWHTIQVQFVLKTTIIYQAMAVHLPRWMFKAIDKIWWGYVWRGRKNAKGGHCLVVWPKVRRPKENGRLGNFSPQSRPWVWHWESYGYGFWNLNLTSHEWACPYKWMLVCWGLLLYGNLYWHRWWHTLLILEGLMAHRWAYPKSCLTNL